MMNDRAKLPHHTHPAIEIRGINAAALAMGTTVYEVKEKLTVDKLFVVKDSGMILQYAGGTTTPTQVADVSGNYVNVFATVISPTDHISVLSNPILVIDQGALVEKALQTYGFLGSSSDPQKGFGGGAILLGHGLEDPADPPRINLTDGAFKELVITSGNFGNGINNILADLKVNKLTANSIVTINGSSYISRDVNGFIDVAGITFGAGYPCLGRNQVGSDYILEVVMPSTSDHPNGLPADFLITGNVTVGRADGGGGLSATGTIGTSGSWFQMGNDTQAMRIYKESHTSGDVTRTVVSIQDYSQSSWLLSNLNVSFLFADHIKSASNDGIYFFDALRLCYSPNGSSYTGVKLYDGYNVQGSNGQVLTSQTDGTTRWQSQLWNAGTVNALDASNFAIVSFSNNGASRTNTAIGYITGQSTMTVTSAPHTQGRHLVMAVGYQVSGSQQISGISQNNTTWTRIMAYVDYSASPYILSELWLGVPSANAGSTVTISFSGGTVNAVAHVFEYSGLDTSSPVVASNTASSSISGSPISFYGDATVPASILLVSIFGDVTGITNGGSVYSMYDGGNRGGYSLASFEKSTTSSGTYSSTATTNGGHFIALQVCLRAANQVVQQKLTFIGSGGGGGGGSGGVSYVASSPITISGNTIGFNPTGYALSCASVVTTGAVTASGNVTGLDVYASHFKSSADNTAYIQNWSGVSGGLTTSGAFNVNGNLQLSGYHVFNAGSNAFAYLVWANNYTLHLGASSDSGCGSYNYNSLTYYYGALDVGAVYLKYLQPLNANDGITLGGNLTLGLNKTLTDAANVSSATSGKAGYVLTVSSTGVPIWAAPQNPGSGETTFLRSSITDFWTTPFWSNITDKPQELDLTSNVRFNNLTLTGTLGTTGSALTITPDVNFAHANSVYVNANSTNGGAAIFNLQCSGVTKGAFGYKPESDKTYLIAYANNNLDYSELHLIGSKIVVENDFTVSHSGAALSVINSTNSYAELALQTGSTDRLRLIHDGTNAYLNAINGSLNVNSLNFTNVQMVNVTSSRVVDNAYQNTSGRTKIVTISIYITGSGQTQYDIAHVDIGDGTNSWTIANMENGYTSRALPVTLLVPSGWYITVVNYTGHASRVQIQSWMEVTL